MPLFAETISGVEESMLRWLIVPLTLIGGIAFAGETPPAKLVLQAERSSFYGMEQTSLVFEKERVVFVTNSNFLQAIPGRALLGEMQSPYTEGLRQSRTKVQETSSKKLAEKKRGYVSPHEVKVSIGGRPLPIESAEYRAMLAVLEQALGLADWKSVDTLEVMAAAKGFEGLSKVYAPGEAVAATPKSAQAQKSECQDLGSRDIVCRYPQYGYARLRKDGFK